MAEKRRPTDGLRRVAREALRMLHASEFVSSTSIVAETQSSPATVKRAMDWLRDEGAPVTYVEKRRAWTLHGKTFDLPFDEPTNEDLEAVLVAAGVLAGLGQEKAAARARGLFNQLAHRVPGGATDTLRLGSLRVTLATTRAPDPRHLLLLLGAARRSVVQIASRSPWTRKSDTHEFEPWQVWLHDGVAYVRGYSLTRKSPRTFRLANIVSLFDLKGRVPSQRVPDNPWDGADPRFGIDEDRPGTAILRVRGAVARWLESLRWHPNQEAVWIERDELLEFRLPYRSCREIARRIATLGDGLVSVEPRELRDELRKIASAALDACREAEDGNFES